MKKNYLFLFSAMLLIIISAKGQIAVNSAWTWMKGNTVIHVSPVYGTKGIASPDNNPGRRKDGLTWTDASGNFWLFGGYDGDYHNDLWEYNPVTNQWTWVSGTNIPNDHGTYGIKGTSSVNNAPASRAEATGWQDAGGNFWIFGGTAITDDNSVPFGIEALNDLWKYNPITNEWTWMSGSNTTEISNYGMVGVASPTNVPGARGGAMGWTDNSGKFWLFSGNVVYQVGLSATPIGDMWRYNPATNQWTWMNGVSSQQASVHSDQGTYACGNIPFFRSNATTFKDADGNFWMFGGVTIVGTWGDVWKFNPSLNLWAWMKGDPDNYNVAGSYGTLGVAAPTNNPDARYKSTGWADAYGNLLVFGGTPEGQCACHSFNDLWSYNISTNQWTWIKGDNTTDQPGVYGTQGVVAATNKPGARFGSYGWIDAGSNIWLYGGDGFDITGTRGHLSDLWKLSGCSDPNPPQIKFNRISIVEGNAGTLNAVFTLELSNTGSCQPVSVNYTTQNGTALAGQDYTAVSGTVIFPTNSTIATVTVPVIGDLLNEPEEYFTLQLSNPVFATLGATSRKCVIEDNDPEPALSINDVTVYENAGQAMLTISLSAPSGKQVRVKYKTVNGTAVQPQDYTKTNDEAIINAGLTSAFVVVPIINNPANEPTENFTVQLSNAQNAGIADGSGTVTILNGNAPAARTTAKSSASGPKENKLIEQANAKQPNVKQFNVRVMNNPASTSFQLYTESNSSQSINVKISDVNGKLIEVMKNLSAGQAIRLGNSYKAGIYFAEVVQGQNRKVVKLVKL